MYKIDNFAFIVFIDSMHLVSISRPNKDYISRFIATVEWFLQRKYAYHLTSSLAYLHVCDEGTINAANEDVNQTSKSCILCTFQHTVNETRNRSILSESEKSSET